MSVVLQPGGVERVFFPLVLIVFRDFRPIQSAGPTPAVDDDSVLERLIACGDYHAIALSRCSWLVSAPVKRERPKPEVFQAFTDITRPMAAIATFAYADVDQKALKLRVENDVILACETARGRVRGHR